MKTSDNLTIIIPTHNRHKYLDRVLDYYSNYSLKIIVADSSKTPYKFDVGKVNFEYYHTPNVSLHSKLYSAVQKVTTQYMVLLGDDDFIMPNAIEPCINFLDENPLYVSASGNEVWFFNEFVTNFYPLRLNSYRTDINREKSSERIKQLFENYTYLHYSIHRTENLMKIYGILNDLPDAYIKYCQVFLDLISIINGKHIILPVFYGCREMTLSSATFTSSFAKPESSEKNIINVFFERLSKHLATAENIEMSEAEKIIRGVFQSDEEGGKPIFKNQNLKGFINKIPNIKNIKEFYTRIVFKSKSIKSLYFDLRISYSRLVKQAKKLEGYPFNKNEGNLELKKIKRQIRKFWYKIRFSK